MTFGLPPGEQFLGYPVAWSRQRPAARSSPLQRGLVSARGRSDQVANGCSRDERGVTHAISIPPPLIRAQAIAEMRADAERLVAPQFRADRAADRRADPSADLRSRDRRAWRSAGWRSWATRHSWRGRMSAPEFRRRRTTPPRWRTRCRMSRTSKPRSSVLRRRRRSENCRIIERARHLGAYLQATRTAGRAGARRTAQHRCRQ